MGYTLVMEDVQKVTCSVVMLSDMFGHMLHENELALFGVEHLCHRLLQKKGRRRFNSEGQVEFI